MLVFVELDGFADDWAQLGLDDEELHALQMELLERPEQGVVVAGTGGLRKVRFSPARWNTGKSGASRVCYVYFCSDAIVLLVCAYAKNTKSDLTPKEKSAIKRLIAGIENTYDNRSGE